MSLMLGSVSTAPSWHGLWLRLIEDTTPARGALASALATRRDHDLLFSAPLPPLFACPPRAILAPSLPRAPRHSDVSHAAVLRSTQHTLASTRPRPSTRRHALRSWLRPTLCRLAFYHVASRAAAPQPVTLAWYRSRAVFAVCVCYLPATLVRAGVSAWCKYAVWI
jgi:hypothetical protein